MKERILDISYNNELSHIGSNLSMVDIIDNIYDIKKPEDKFILSAGHAGLALYVVLEKHGLLHDPIESLNVHPDKSEKNNIHVSTGSLGQGLPIALGMALANRDQDVFVASTDGEMTEGSMWESLAIAYDNRLNNLKLVINANGYSAYREMDVKKLISRLMGFGPIDVVSPADPHRFKSILQEKNLIAPTIIVSPTTVEHHSALKGIDAHYHILTKEEYEGKTK